MGVLGGQDVPIVGDIADLADDDVPDHDLLTAGFCCQSFSKAGKQGGFEDARGELFFEVVRPVHPPRASPVHMFTQDQVGACAAFYMSSSASIYRTSCLHHGYPDQLICAPCV